MNEFKKFIELSRILGQKQDFIQGSGGNVSIKTGDGKMFIKASGWRLSDISENNGLAEVNLSEIKSCGAIVATSGPKPSMEIIFHSFLDKFVIHTHSVYANIIACSLNGKLLWEKISKDFNLKAAWVDYNSPGEYLALAVKKTINQYKKKKHNEIPEVILMQNHGLIVSGKKLDRVFGLHNQIQEIIKQRLNLSLFPKNLDDFLKKIIKNNNDFIVNFSKNILFPDQAVFCGNIYKKISINKKTGNLIYKAREKEALAIKENLAAWAYVVDCAKNCGLILKFLSLKDVDYVKNMKNEKYRQNLLIK